MSAPQSVLGKKPDVKKVLSSFTRETSKPLVKGGKSFQQLMGGV